ncbi:MAG: alpha/beta fold hydrolase [Acidobacteriia bacterium]|nr:alpha/beta fold hydrolase [Terriglobia bacterium]
MTIECHSKSTSPLSEIRFKALAVSFLLTAVLSFTACASPGKKETLAPQEAVRARSEPFPGQFAALEGAQIFYLDTGPIALVAPDGREAGTQVVSPVILIHGLGASTFSFRRNIAELSKHARVIALDLKGFGFSKEYSDRDFSFRAESAIVIALMDRLKIPRATLVGHSLGGSIAARVAAVYPGRVDRLVLIDSATLYITRPFVTRLLHGRMFSSLAYQMAGPDRQRVRKLLLKSYADKAKVSDADVEGYYFPFTIKNSAEALRLFLTTSNPNENALFARILAPTLILWGAEDSFIDPSVRDFLHRQVKNSTIEVIEGAGHALMEEKPEAVNQAIIQFIER